MENNPSYTYYAYYMYANIMVLNCLRKYVREKGPKLCPLNICWCVCSTNVCSVHCCRCATEQTAGQRVAFRPRFSSSRLLRQGPPSCSYQARF